MQEEKKEAQHDGGRAGCAEEGEPIRATKAHEGTVKSQTIPKNRPSLPEQFVSMSTPISGSHTSPQNFRGVSVDVPFEKVETSTTFENMVRVSELRHVREGVWSAEAVSAALIS